MIAPSKIRKFHFIGKVQHSNVVHPTMQVFGLNNDIQALIPMINAYQQIENNLGYDGGFSRIVGYMVKSVEGSINTGLEDKIFSHHKIIKSIIDKFKDSKNIDLYDKKTGIKYYCINGLRTIQIKQTYKGNIINSEFCHSNTLAVNNKRHATKQQIAIIYPNLLNPKNAKYEFKEFNLDDAHGLTNAIIEDDKFVSIETARNSFAPIKTSYKYNENGKLSHALVNDYSLKNSVLKNALFFFNENREIDKVYYGYKTTKRIGNKIKHYVDAEFVKDNKTAEFKFGRINFSY